MGWRVTFAGQTITDEDATVGEYATIVQITGRPGWELMNPDVSPDVLAAWCICAAMRGGTSIQDALGGVNQVPVKALMGAFDNREEVAATNGDMDPETIQARITALQAMADQAKAARESG